MSFITLNRFPPLLGAKNLRRTVRRTPRKKKKDSKTEWLSTFEEDFEKFPVFHSLFMGLVISRSNEVRKFLQVLSDAYGINIS